MSTAGSASNLVQAARELSNDWQQTKAFWHDVKPLQPHKEFDRTNNGTLRIPPFR
jgi:hypothetical protein